MGIEIKGCRWILALCTVLTAPLASAAEWLTQATLKQQLNYNDNIRLSTRNQDSIFGYAVNPGIMTQRRTEDVSLGLNMQGDIRRNDDTRWDCDNYSVETDDQYKGRRNGFGFVGGYAKSCMYLQQLGDTGLLTPKATYQSFKLAPSWRWQWTPRDQIVADATYTKTDYTRDASNSDYVFHGNQMTLVNLGGNHQWDPRLSLNGGMSYSKIDYTDGDRPEQNVYGFQFGGNYDLDRTLKLSLGGGPRWIDTQSRPDYEGGVRLGHVVNVSIHYDGVLNHLTAGYSNAINPSSLGRVLQYQSLYTRYSWRFLHDWTLDLDAQYSRMESVAKDLSVNYFNRDYVAVAIGATWQFARDFDLVLRYGYRYQQYDSIAGTAQSNSIMLGVGYRFDIFRGAY